MFERGNVLHVTPSMIEMPMPLETWYALEENSSKA
jgi:hypothetical protein